MFVITGYQNKQNWGEKKGNKKTDVILMIAITLQNTMNIWKVHIYKGQIIEYTGQEKITTGLECLKGRNWVAIL